MTQKIREYLQSKISTIHELEIQPIILKWLKSSSMRIELEIINKHVEYLLNNSARGKLEQWFLSDDRGFNSITAERYIIWYLRQKNPTLSDNLKSQGVDASLELENETVGIEVTTLNGFFAHWVLLERLSEYLNAYGLTHNNGYEITYSNRRIVKEMNENNIYQYIYAIGDAIAQGNIKFLEELEILALKTNRGSVSWIDDDSRNLSWFPYVTDELASKLKAKEKQLTKYERNIVFVGVNHLSPLDGVYPYIFEAIAGCNEFYQDEAIEVENYWRKELCNFPNVTGICFFLYTLKSEEPFYPLRILWRDEKEMIPLIV